MRTRGVRPRRRKVKGLKDGESSFEGMMVSLYMKHGRVWYDIVRVWVYISYITDLEAGSEAESRKLLIWRAEHSVLYLSTELARAWLPDHPHALKRGLDHAPPVSGYWEQQAIDAPFIAALDRWMMDATILSRSSADFDTPVTRATSMSILVPPI